VTTISVVIETPGAHRERRSTWTSPPLERYAGARGGRFEIHAVLDDADTKLTALIAAADRTKEMARWPNPMNRLRREDARIHAGAGTCCSCRRTPATGPLR
jgi:predicted aminopeptidase